MWWSRDDDSWKFNYLNFLHTKSKAFLSDFDSPSQKENDYFRKKTRLIPDTLYRYCKPNIHNIEALKNGYIWASHTQLFNDPFEGNYQIDYEGYIRYQLAKKIEREGLVKENSTNHLSKMEYSKIRYTYNDFGALHLDLFHLQNQIFKTKSPQLQKKLKGIIETNQAKLRKIENQIGKTVFFVSSFTEESKNPPMWAHYAENYEGFLIEYDLGAMKEKWGKTESTNEHFLMNRIFPVKYHSAQPVISKSHLIKSKSIGSRLAFEDKVIKSLLTKEKPWAYEKEWRILADPKSRGRGYCIAFPYVKKVTCGYNMDRNYLEQLHQICVEKNIEFIVQYKYPWSKFPSAGTYEDFIRYLDLLALLKKAKH
jgi:hypothetical protein